MPPGVSVIRHYKPFQKCLYVPHRYIAVALEKKCLPNALNVNINVNAHVRVIFTLCMCFAELGQLVLQ